MTTVATLLACTPSLAMLLYKSTKKTFLLCQLAVCLAFFMLSMQVHEKQILSPIFILCLCVTNGVLKDWYVIANMIALGSMFGLIILNESWLVLFVLMLAQTSYGWSSFDVLKKVLCLAVLLSTIVAYYGKSDLVHLVLHAFYFVCFSGFYLYVNYLIWLEVKTVEGNKKVK